MESFKELFLLDPQIVYLNHGSYGATPRAVFEVYQHRQLQLEREPARFINNDLPSLLKDARGALGAYLGADADDLVYVPNATFGINIVARALPLKPGDEVLTTNQEYGATYNLWKHICQKHGATLIKQPVSFPVASEAEMLEEIWQGVTPRTKVIFLSHITSPTALRFPVEPLCQRARDADLITVIDGAHAPGHIALNLDALGADFYVGNCHKWLCGPKGAGFLHTQRSRQPLIEPLIIGWGWGENRKPSNEPPYIDAMQRLGTDDLSAYLAVPAAIDFQSRHNWLEIRECCHRLLETGLERASELTGLNATYPQQGRFYEQMAVFELPPIRDLAAFNDRLYQKHRIQIPCVAWNERQFIRISIQAYNSKEDLDNLFNALERELPTAQS